jgi:hypothetical protein
LRKIDGSLTRSTEFRCHAAVSARAPCRLPARISTNHADHSAGSLHRQARDGSSTRISHLVIHTRSTKQHTCSTSFRVGHLATTPFRFWKEFHRTSQRRIKPEIHVLFVRLQTMYTNIDGGLIDAPSQTHQTFSERPLNTPIAETEVPVIKIPSPKNFSCSTHATPPTSHSSIGAALKRAFSIRVIIKEDQSARERVQHTHH